MTSRYERPSRPEPKLAAKNPADRPESNVEPVNRRLQIVLSPEAVEKLDGLRKARNGATRADILRESLFFYDWARRQIEDGYKFALIKDGELTQQLVLPFEM